MCLHVFKMKLTCNRFKQFSGNKQCTTKTEVRSFSSDTVQSLHNVNGLATVMTYMEMNAIIVLIDIKH